MTFNKNTKRIIFVTDYVKVGGSRTFLNDLLKEYYKAKIYVEVIFFSKEKVDDEEYKSSRFNFIKIPSLNYLFTFYRFFSLISWISKFKKHNTVILTDLFFPAFSLILIKKFFRIKTNIVYQFHGFDSYEQQSRAIYENIYKSKHYLFSQILKKIIERFVLRNVDEVICFSNYSKSLVMKELKNFKNISVINPGYSSIFGLNKFTKKEYRQQIGLSNEAKVILYIGRIEPRKGIFNFFNELEKNLDFSKKYTILFVSSFTDSSFAIDLFELSKKTNYISNILFINNPPRKDIDKFYYASDLMILPSLDLETFGFVTLEAMACDLPTVGFDIGANEDLINKNLLVDRKSGMKGIIDKIDYYFSLENKKKRLIISSLKNKTNDYTYKNYVSNLDKYFTKLS